MQIRNVKNRTSYYQDEASNCLTQVFNAIPKNKTLKSLQLSTTGTELEIPESLAAPLCKAIAASSLNEFYIFQFNFGQSLGDEFKQVLRNNLHLTKVNIYGSNISIPQEEELFEAVGKNAIYLQTGKYSIDCDGICPTIKNNIIEAKRLGDLISNSPNIEDISDEDAKEIQARRYAIIAMRKDELQGEYNRKIFLTEFSQVQKNFYNCDEIKELEAKIEQIIAAHQESHANERDSLKHLKRSSLGVRSKTGGVFRV